MPSKPGIYKNYFEQKYDRNNISFEFVALHFSNPQRNKYAYKLEGVDENWRYSGTRRFANYLNLTHGNYIFRVKGSNCDGIWNEKGTSIAFVINPPFWLTWWAYSIYVALFILSIYSIDIIQTKNVRKKRERKPKKSSK